MTAQILLDLKGKKSCQQAERFKLFLRKPLEMWVSDGFNPANFRSESDVFCHFRRRDPVRRYLS